MNKTKTINFHINWKCNADCIYCFRPEGRELAFKDKCEIIAAISQLPGDKRRINFAGGEPTLVKELPDLLEFTKSLGLDTSVITNGSEMCKSGIQRYAPHLDMLGVSVDSACAHTNKLLKRPTIRAEDLVKLATEIHASSTPLKVNTVVTSCNVSEDLSDLLNKLKPQRWKIFRAISVAGTNDMGSKPWRVSDRQFDEFVTRHRHLRASGIDMVVENDDDLRGSYVMISPDGRFYDSTLGGYQFSDSILDVGLETAFNQIVYLPGKFIDRGGDFRIDQYLPSP